MASERDINEKDLVERDILDNSFNYYIGDRNEVVREVDNPNDGVFDYEADND